MIASESRTATSAWIPEKSFVRGAFVCASVPEAKGFGRHTSTAKPGLTEHILVEHRAQCRERRPLLDLKP